VYICFVLLQQHCHQVTTNLQFEINNAIAADDDDNNNNNNNNNNNRLLSVCNSTKLWLNSAATDERYEYRHGAQVTVTGFCFPHINIVLLLGKASFQFIIRRYTV
jgi:hypothetical protein